MPSYVHWELSPPPPINFFHLLILGHQFLYGKRNKCIIMRETHFRANAFLWSKMGVLWDSLKDPKIDKYLYNIYKYKYLAPNRYEVDLLKEVLCTLAYQEVKKLEVRKKSRSLQQNKTMKILVKRPLFHITMSICSGMTVPWCISVRAGQPFKIRGSIHLPHTNFLFL